MAQGIFPGACCSGGCKGTQLNPPQAAGAGWQPGTALLLGCFARVSASQCPWNSQKAFPPHCWCVSEDALDGSFQ